MLLLIQDIYKGIAEPIKYMIDVVTIGAAWAAFLAMIPALTAVASLVWLGLRIYETWLTIKEKKRNALKE